MASTVRNIGALYTQRGGVEEAIPLNLRSLSLASALGSPEASKDVYWLTRQREMLGAERFGEVLRRHLDEDGVAAVLKSLEDFAAARAKGG